VSGVLLSTWEKMSILWYGLYTILYLGPEATGLLTDFRYNPCISESRRDKDKRREDKIELHSSPRKLLCQRFCSKTPTA